MRSEFIGLYICLLLVWLSSTQQVKATEITTDSIDQEDLTMHSLDLGPYTSARADGLGGALTCVADTMTAAYFNPAGIGGFYVGKETNAPWVRVLHFPYTSITANQNYLNNNASTDSEFQKNMNERYFRRASGAVAIGVGRFMMMGFDDTQLLMIPKEIETDSTTKLDSIFRNTLGLGAGMSIAIRDRLYFGAFSALENRNQFKGDLNPRLLINYLKFNSYVMSKSDSYRGLATHAGILWEIQQVARPTLSVVVKNIGGSIYTKNSSHSPTQQAFTLTEPQDVTLGFGLSPTIGSVHGINFMFEAHRLLDQERALYRRLKTAIEWDLWGFASRARLSFRAGFSYLGASAGFGLNLSLLQLEMATTPVELAHSGNITKVERRYSAVVSTNLAEW